MNSYLLYVLLFFGITIAMTIRRILFDSDSDLATISPRYFVFACICNAILFSIMFAIAFTLLKYTKSFDKKDVLTFILSLVIVLISEWGFNPKVAGYFKDRYFSKKRTGKNT